MEGDETDARLWEIAENLHRSELTVQERADQIAEWLRLTDGKLRKLSAESGGRGNQGGVREAARQLNTDEKAVRNAVKIASITDEAKEAAREISELAPLVRD